MSDTPPVVDANTPPTGGQPTPTPTPALTPYRKMKLAAQKHSGLLVLLGLAVGAFVIYFCGVMYFDSVFPKSKFTDEVLVVKFGELDSLKASNTGLKNKVDELEAKQVVMKSLVDDYGVRMYVAEGKLLEKQSVGNEIPANISAAIIAACGKTTSVAKASKPKQEQVAKAVDIHPIPVVIYRTPVDKDSFWGWVYPGSTVTNKGPCVVDRQIYSPPPICSSLKIVERLNGEGEKEWNSRVAIQNGIKGVMSRVTMQ